MIDLIILIILILIFIWFVLGFTIPILIFPLMPIKKRDIPKKIPKELEQEINKLKKIKNKEKFLKAALGYIRKNFRSDIPLLFTKISKHFYKDLEEIMKEKGFFPCHIQNFILKVILIKSKKFSNKDIEYQYCFYSGVIHSYLKVKINGKYINADPWGYTRGLPFGHRSLGPLLDWITLKKYKKFLKKGNNYIYRSQ